MSQTSENLYKYFDSKPYNKNKLDGYTVIPYICDYNNHYNSVLEFRGAFIQTQRIKISVGSINSLRSGFPVPSKASSMINFMKEAMKNDFKGIDDIDVFQAEVKAIKGSKIEGFRGSLSQKELAKELNCSEFVIKWVEKGKPISKKFAEKLLDFLVK